MAINDDLFRSSSETLKTRWASPENPGGEPGAAATANAGRKGRPNLPLAAGESVTLAEETSSDEIIGRYPGRAAEVCHAGGGDSESYRDDPPSLGDDLRPLARDAARPAPGLLLGRGRHVRSLRAIWGFFRYRSGTHRRV